MAIWLCGYVAMWLCGYVDKFQNTISCFQIDAGPIFKIFKKFLEGSSSFFGALRMIPKNSKIPNRISYCFGDFGISIGKL